MVAGVGVSAYIWHILYDFDDDSFNRQQLCKWTGDETKRANYLRICARQYNRERLNVGRSLRLL